MKQRTVFLVHMWNIHTGKWDPLRTVEAYTSRQACYFIASQFSIKRSDLSAKPLPAAPAAAGDTPPEDPPLRFVF